MTTRVEEVRDSLLLTVITCDHTCGGSKGQPVVDGNNVYHTCGGSKGQPVVDGNNV